MADEKIYNLYHCGYLDIREWLKETDIILVPLGSCEQHGRHLPVCTDGVATEVPIERAARLANVPHTPLIWIGYSPHHLHPAGTASGTITLRQTVYQSMLYDVARCLIHNGFNKIIFATGHSSNMKVIEPPLRTVRYETGAFVCLFRNDAEAAPQVCKDILENPPEETPGWHGSEIETSEVLAYNEKLVHLERTEKEFTHAPSWLGDAFSKRNGSSYVTYKGADVIWLPMEHQEYSDTGLIGNPFRASAEKGDRIFQRKAEILAAFCEEIKDLKVEVRNRSYDLRTY
ncbi:MAG: creatininase family protein [bacterium]